MNTLDERLKKLGGKETEKLKKDGETSAPKKNGGARPGSGRKKTEKTKIEADIKKYLHQHFNEKVSIKMVDPKTGKSKIIKMPRVVRALEKLYEIGVANDNADALNKWLDRALGKAPQPIEGSEDKPILLKIDF